MARTKITRHDIRLACPDVDPHALSARYIPYCGGSLPADDVEDALHYLAMVWNEVPSGMQNGINLLFQTTVGFRAGTLQVHLNGLRVKSGLDYTEGPGANQFTMHYAPWQRDELLVDYGWG